MIPPIENCTTRWVHKANANGTAATILILLGIAVFLFIHWILGLILFFIGVVLSFGTRKYSSCGECGNEVANTSRVCPHCSSRFTLARKAPRGNAVFYSALGSLLVAGIIGAGMWWIINHANQ